MVLNAETLRILVAKFARYTRLTELKRPSQAVKAEAFLIKCELEDMGFSMDPKKNG